MVGISANGKRKSRTEFSQYGNLPTICPNRPKRETDRFASVNGIRPLFQFSKFQTGSFGRMEISHQDEANGAAGDAGEEEVAIFQNGVLLIRRGVYSNAGTIPERSQQNF